MNSTLSLTSSSDISAFATSPSILTHRQAAFANTILRHVVLSAALTAAQSQELPTDIP
jgi:hypothetical protein